MALEAWCQRNPNAEWLAQLVACQARACVDIFIIKCVTRSCTAVSIEQYTPSPEEGGLTTTFSMIHGVPFLLGHAA